MTYICELFRILSTVSSETSCFIRGRHTWHTSTKICCTIHIHIKLPKIKTQFHYNRFVYWVIVVYFSLKYCWKQRSWKSFQYNTEGRRLSNYSIKLILCPHYRSRCKGLCQDKKHEFDQHTMGGHFCAAHMALNIVLYEQTDHIILKLYSF